MTNVELVKKVFERLRLEGRPITPDSFREAYCAEAKRVGMVTTDCHPLQKYGPRLDEKIRTQLNSYPVKNMDEFVQYLISQLNRLMGPERSSDNQDVDIPELLRFVSHPSLLNEPDNETRALLRDYQKDVEAFCQQGKDNVVKLLKARIKADREEVTKHDKEIESLIDVLSGQLISFIENNTGHRENLSSIKNELVEMDAKNVHSIHVKLTGIADALSSELEQLDETLRAQQTEVNSLKSQILAMERELEEAKEEASLDFLTNVFTRRTLDNEIKRHDSLFARNKAFYTVVFFDIDYFKKVNDTYGHEAGDKVLAGFGRLLRDNARNEDIIGRYGGEEFLVLLPETDLEGGKKFAENIRRVVEQSKFIYKKETLKVTVSGGVAERARHESKELMLINADQMLYEAKKNGRNRVYPQ